MLPEPRPRSTNRGTFANFQVVERKKQTKRRGLFEQFGDAAVNIGKGLVVDLPKMVAEQAYAPVKPWVDWATGGGGPTSTGLEDFDSFDRSVREVLPLPMAFSDSAARTAGNVRHPTRYRDAWREGRIVDTVLEDVGNAAMFTGVGAATAKAAGAGRLASVLERASVLGGKTADAPISVPRALLERGGRWVRDSSPYAPALRARFPTLLTEDGALWKQAARTGERQGGRMSAQEWRAAMPGKDAPLAEQGAAIAMLRGTGDLYKQMVDSGLDPEEARQRIVVRDRAEQSFTPDVAEATLRYFDDPEMQARVDTLMDEYAGRIEGRTDSALTGRGRIKGEIDERWLDDNPIPEYVHNELVAEGSRGLAEGFEGRALSVDDLRGLVDDADLPLLEQVLDNPMVWPKRWRQVMGEAARAGLPARPSSLLESGVRSPTYIPGGESSLLDPVAQSTGRTPTTEGVRGLKTLSSEHKSVGSDFSPMSSRTLTERLAEEAYRTERNAAIADAVNDPRTRKVADLIDGDTLARFRAEADRLAEAERGTPRQMKTRADQIYGGFINDALAEQGYEALPGDIANPGDGDFNPDMKALPERVNENTVALPAGTKARLTPFFTAKGTNIPHKVLEYANRKFKGAVLPFSARWQLGDLVGGSIMSWVGGGIPPWELVKNLEHVADDVRANVLDNPQLASQGLNFEEARFRDLSGAALREPRTPIGRFQRWSFDKNAAINRLNRHGYALAKLQRLLDERGLGQIDDIAINHGWDAPDVQKAISEAIDDANRVMGTFDEMTPFERRWVKNVFPFWAWNRHITALTLRTAVDNPARIMWTLRLGSLASDPDEDLPPWLRGSINVGGHLIPTNYFNPFNDVAGGSMFTPEGALRSTSPAIKLATAGVFGKDMNRGLADVSRPFGTGRTDELGRDTFTPLALRPLELGYYAARMFPITREAMNLAPTGQTGSLGLGPHPRYGQGTLMVDDRGNPIDTTSRITPLLRLAGVPYDPDATEARAAEIMANAEKRRTRRKRQSGLVQRGLG